MDTPQVIAPPCASSGSSGFSGGVLTPTSGVIHVNARHTTGFTVIGNHLAQHEGLSLVAIGLAAHIQSLPAGAKVGIKVLVGRFPESETRIAAALRELEAAGYLHRSRVRLPGGRVVTRTVSYNRPGATAEPHRAPPRPPRPASSSPAPPVPVPPPPPAPVPAPTAPRTPSPALPQPLAPAEGLYRTAAALLADLRRHAPGLALSEGDIRVLTPGIATWLERDTDPEAIRHALTADLPVPVKYPAKLVRHRITTRLPPPLPGTGDLAPPRRKAVVVPLQNCDGCERAFRATEPGHCGDCRADHPDLHTAA